MTAAFWIGVAILLIPNLAFATVILWMHVATDARLTLRGHRYVSFLFSLVLVGLFMSLWGFVGWLETAP